MIELSCEEKTQAIERNRIWKATRTRTNIIQYRDQRKAKKKLIEEVNEELFRLRNEMVEQGYTLWRKLSWIKQ